MKTKCLVVSATSEGLLSSKIENELRYYTARSKESRINIITQQFSCSAGFWGNLFSWYAMIEYTPMWE